jgi:hypothetical protein
MPVALTSKEFAATYGDEARTRLPNRSCIDAT